MEKINETKAHAKKGGAGLGQGRKSLLGGAGKSAAMMLRVTPAQQAKVKERGGAAWVRGMIDAA